jgi:hypothetical protein
MGSSEAQTDLKEKGFGLSRALQKLALTQSQALSVSTLKSSAL